ncbi:MAG TPA: tyrosine-type recombinase/integrase [Metabacillus sp.]|nr:tyrosine-type recombinase/integrase [Metabacillus sp.]
MPKKRSRFLSEEELNLLDEQTHDYVENWSEAMQMFQKDGELRGLREATLFYYEKEVRMAIRYLNEQQLGLLKPYELTKEHIEQNIILYMKNDKQLSVSSINIRLTALKAFIKWLYDNKKIPSNPTQGIKKLKNRKKEIEVFSPDQLRRFFNAIEKNTWIGIRDRAICLVLLECGCRQNELLNLNVSDINWEQNYLLIRHTKTFQMRKVPITEVTKKALKRWLLVRGEAKTEQLFCSITNLKLSPRGLHQIIVKYGRKANIQGVRCSPHTFRSTCASLYVKSSGDLFSLQRIMGWTDISMAKVYVKFMHEDVSELHKKHSPLNNLDI